MKIGGKLIAIIVVLIVSLGVVSIYSIGKIAENGNSMYYDRVIPVSQLAGIAKLSEDTRVQMLTALNTQDPARVDQAERNINEIAQLIEAYAISYMPPEEKAVFDSFVANWNQFTPIVRDNIILARSRSFEELSAGLIRGREPYEKASRDAERLLEINQQIARQIAEENMRAFKTTRLTVLIVIVGAILLAIGLGALLTKNIVTPIRKISDQAQKVAQGDLTMANVIVKNKDEIGKLADDFNLMTTNLKNVITQVFVNSEQVASTAQQLTASSEQTSKASEQISLAIQEVASGAEKQAAGTDEATQVVMEISSNMEQIASNINSVVDLSTNTSSVADEGNQVVAKAIEQMNLINQKNNSTAGVINSLSNKSGEIGQIVSLIGDIAGQTNLLALNAAIEAARAGESGKGFAVVAEEVRKLAEQSSKAAGEISKLIKDIQAESTNAVTATSEGTVAVKEGITMVNQAGNAFQNIFIAVNDVFDQAKEVSVAAKQIQAGVRNMVSLVEGIANVSSQVAGNSQDVAAAVQEQNASMEEIASAANMLANMAVELQTSVNKFKV